MPIRQTDVIMRHIQMLITSEETPHEKQSRANVMLHRYLLNTTTPALDAAVKQYFVVRFSDRACAQPRYNMLNAICQLLIKDVSISASANLRAYARVRLVELRGQYDTECVIIDRDFGHLQGDQRKMFDAEVDVFQDIIAALDDAVAVLDAIDLALNT